MSTEERSREERALSRFIGQMDAHTSVVEQIAEYLRSEGIDSYARPLEATANNLDEALQALLFEFSGGDLEAEVVELNVVQGEQSTE